MSDVTTGRTPAYSITEVLEVLDPETLQAWYESPEYAPARQIAATAMRRRLIFLPGIAPTA